MTLPWRTARPGRPVGEFGAPLRLLTLLLLVIGLGITLCIVVAPARWTPTLWLLAAQLFLLTVAAQCFPVQLVPNSTVLPTTAPLFAMVLLLPWPLALTLAATAVLLAALVRHEPQVSHAAFTAGTVIVQLAAAIVAAAWCGWAPGQLDPRHTALLAFAPLAAAAALYGTNLLLVELTLPDRHGQSVWDGLRHRWPPSFLQEGTLLLLGALFVRTALHAPWLLGLMAVPLVVVYRSLRDAVALRASEAQLRALAQHALDVVVIVDGQERVRSVNAAAFQLFGVAPETLAREPLLGRIHPADQPLLQAVLAGAGRSTGADTPPVIRCRHRDGSWRDVELHCTDLRGEPAVAGLVLVLRDISRRRRVEQAQGLLVEATGRFASVLDEARVLDDLAQLVVPALADWCVVECLDADGTLHPTVIAHPGDESAVALATTLQTSRAALADVPHLARVVASGRSSITTDRANAVWPQFVRAHAALPPTPEATPLSLLVVPLCGGERTLGTLSLLRLPERRAFDGSDRDLVATLAGRAALCVENGRLYAQAQAASRQRDEFFAAASHDLRTPVTTIAGFAQLLARRVPEADAASAELVDGIAAGARRLAGQIDQLLDVARLQAGQALAVRRSAVDLVAIVREAVAEQQRTSPRHQFLLDVGASTCIGLWDGTRLDRIVSNLLVNAVKYSPAGGTVRVRVVDEVDGAGAWATLAVADEGIGIAAAEQVHIFERYYRASNVNPRIAGSGIGLATVAEFVRQHGGQISVESEAGAGALFRVRLPLRRADEDRRAAERGGTRTA